MRRRRNPIHGIDSYAEADDNLKMILRMHPEAQASVVHTTGWSTPEGDVEVHDGAGRFYISPELLEPYSFEAMNRGSYLPFKPWRKAKALSNPWFSPPAMQYVAAFNPPRRRRRRRRVLSNPGSVHHEGTPRQFTVGGPSTVKVTSFFPTGPYGDRDGIVTTKRGDGYMTARWYTRGVNVFYGDSKRSSSFEDAQDTHIDMRDYWMDSQGREIDHDHSTSWPAMSNPFEPGDVVGAGRWPYSGGHPDAWQRPWQGRVLAREDPRAWAGSLAFPDADPDPAAVAAHVRKHRKTLGDDYPVLWDFGDEQKVYWHEEKPGRYGLKPYAEDLAAWEAARGARSNPGSRYEAKVKLAQQMLVTGGIYHIKTSYYGRSITITVGPNITATGSGGAVAAHVYPPNTKAGPGFEGGFRDVAHWLAQHVASISDLRRAMRSSSARSNPGEWKVQRVSRSTRSPIHVQGINLFKGGEPFSWAIDPRHSGSYSDDRWDFSEATWDEDIHPNVVAYTIKHMPEAAVSAPRSNPGGFTVPAWAAPALANPAASMSGKGSAALEAELEPHHMGGYELTISGSAWGPHSIWVPDLSHKSRQRLHAHASGYAFNAGYEPADGDQLVSQVVSQVLGGR